MCRCGRTMRRAQSRQFTSASPARDGINIRKEKIEMSMYQIDPAHASAQFKVRHMMIANVKGEFDKIIGTVNYDPANPSASTVDATIEVASISTRDEQRDAHLKSADFFDVEKFPTITYKSRKVTATG